MIRLRRVWMLFMAAVVLGGLLAPGARSVPAVQGAGTAKKVCKTVKKHGKKKRVCHTVKPTPTPTPQPTPIVPNPLNVVPHVDGARATSATLGLAGGTLVATGADGTTYALSVPANAVPAGTTISMTPVTALDGLPASGGLKAAVLLGPEGLQPAQLVTLVITPAQPVPVDTQMPMMATGTGGDLHLYPAVMTAGSVTMKLSHFSIPGLGGGSLQDVKTMLSHAPSVPAAQIEQLAAAAILGAARNDPATQSLGDLILAGARASYPGIVADLQAAMGGDWLAAGRATDRGLGWIRALGLVGMDHELVPEQQNIVSLITKVMAAQFTKSLGLCTHDHQVGIFLAMARAVRFLGLGGIAAVNDATILDGIDRCIRFDLDYTQSYTRHTETNHQAGSILNTGAEDTTSHASISRLPLRIDLSAGSIDSDLLGAQGLVFNVQVTGWAKATTSQGVFSSCTWATTGGPGIVPMRVELVVDYQNNAIDTSGKLLPPQILLGVDPGKATGTQKRHCDDYYGKVPSDSTSPDAVSNLAGWNALYSREMNPPNPKNPRAPTTYTVKDWQFVGGDIFAVEDRIKSFSSTSDGYIENAAAEGHFILRHVPAG